VGKDVFKYKNTPDTTESLPTASSTEPPSTRDSTHATENDSQAAIRGLVKTLAI
jgi:hypothetical protein